MKYELTDETIEVKGHTLKRVRYLDTGELGGYIESEENLSQEGNARVSDNACVFGNALVSDNAEVFGNALVYDNALVFGSVWVSGNAEVFGNARVSGNAEVFGNARVYDNAEVYGKAGVYDYACVYGKAHVYDHACVSGDTRVSGDAQIYGNSYVRKGSWDKSPLQIQGSWFFFNVAGPNDIAVGCHIFTVGEWTKVYKQEFKEHKFTKERKAEYIAYFNEASKLYNFGVMLPLPENE
jgi:predicted acyltransferase (DUF342 family)